MGERERERERKRENFTSNIIILYTPEYTLSTIHDYHPSLRIKGGGWVEGVRPARGIILKPVVSHR